LDPIGQVKGARLEPEEESYARVLTNYQKAVADFMVGHQHRAKDQRRSNTKHERFTKADREKAKQITKKDLSFDGGFVYH